MMRLLISLILILTLTGCSDPFIEKPSETIEVSNIVEASDGFYMKTDNTCTPLFLPSNMDSLTYERVLTGEEITYLLSKTSIERIPNLTDSEVILKREDDIKTSIFLASLTDLGFTLGFKLEPKGDSFVIKEHSIAEGSDIESILEETNLKSKRILSVGGVILSPSHLDSAGFIKDLEEDKSYSLTFLEGTVESEVESTADSKALKLSPENLIGEVSLSYTEGGYAILNLPELPQGFYLLLLPDKLNFMGGIFYVP